MPKKIHHVEGVQIGTGNGKIKATPRDDVTVFTFAKPVPTAAVFTQNRFVAAPVVVAKKHIRQGKSQAWIINAGNANCGTGKKGHETALASCDFLAKKLAIKPNYVLPFSTGVILEQLSFKKLQAGCNLAIKNLHAKNWQAAAKAIMTTDTTLKSSSYQQKIKTGNLTVSGIAKGAGMIHPNMATMLAFLVTDADVSTSWLKQSLTNNVNTSFNTISVDGDTSTNDAVVIAATGTSGKPTASQAKQLDKLIGQVCNDLATQIVMDGEGATTYAKVTVRGLNSNKSCIAMADSIANSPLIKTMLYARDPNLGRLLMAIGKTDAKFDINNIKIDINSKPAFRNGNRVRAFTEKIAQRQMKTKPVCIDVSVGNYKTVATKLFSDLSHKYVTINSDYRS